MTLRDDDDQLAEIETTAVTLATIAGGEITRALGGLLEVRYKEKEGAGSLRDPVSEVDERVEQLLRTILADRYPGHGIIGEEMDARPGEGSYVWAVDPIDGTTNFVNGFPMIAASIGVLRDGIPVAGAIWCSTGHALRRGVYHGRAGGRLQFEGETLSPPDRSGVRRRLAGLPEPRSGQEPWDGRKTGSAAIECAFVAAGLLEAARFATPNIWDVAAGMALVPLAGGTILQGTDTGWAPFERFAGGDWEGMRGWSRKVIVGTAPEEELLRVLGGDI